MSLHRRSGDAAAAVKQIAPAASHTGPSVEQPSQPSAATTNAAVAASAVAQRVFVVSSSTDAQALQQMLAAAGAGQGQAELSGVHDTALAAGATVSAADVSVAFGFENEQRAARGLPPIEVEDLR